MIKNIDCCNFELLDRDMNGICLMTQEKLTMESQLINETCGEGELVFFPSVTK